MRTSIAREWERMVPGGGAGPTAEFSTIMLVPETSRQKCGLSRLRLGRARPSQPHNQMRTSLSMFPEGRLHDWEVFPALLLQHFAGPSLLLVTSVPPDTEKGEHAPPRDFGVLGRRGARADPGLLCPWFLPTFPFTLGPGSVGLGLGGNEPSSGIGVDPASWGMGWGETAPPFLTMWTSAGTPSPPGPVVRICTRAWPMSSGTATSIQFLLVRWSVGVGCRSFW